MRPDGLLPDTPERLIDRPLPARFNPFLRLLLFGLLAGLGVFVCGGLAMLVAGRGAMSDFLSWPAQIANLVALTTAFLLLVLWVEKRRPPHELEISRWPGLLKGLGLGALLMLLVFVVVWALGGLDVQGLRTPDWGTWAIMVFGAGVVAGATEEFIFRGVVLRITEELLGTWGAVALSGLIFGFVHLGNEDATLWGALAIALEAGVVLGLLYVLTRSLWVVIGLHAAWNVVQGPVLGIPVSGVDPNGFLDVTPKGSELLSGGAFGLEASVVSVVVMLALALWLGLRAGREDRIIAPMWARRARQRRLAGQTPTGELA